MDTKVWFVFHIFSVFKYALFSCENVFSVTNSVEKQKISHSLTGWQVVGLYTEVQIVLWTWQAVVQSC